MYSVYILVFDPNTLVPLLDKPSNSGKTIRNFLKFIITMKSIYLMGFIALSVLFITSCEKSSQTDEITTTDFTLNSLANNTTEAQDAMNELETLQDELLELREGGACPTITSSAPKGSFPNVVTIDYGTGCIDSKGRYHSGKIVIEQSDSMQNTGAVRKTTFVNFGMDSMKVKDGVVTLTHESNNSIGHKRFVRKSNDLSITGPKGTIDIQFTHARIQVAGGNTPSKSDDVWHIEGESKGTVNGELKYSAVIKEPLVLRGDCPYIVNGKEKLNRNGHEIVVDFGNGNCDRFAIGKKENGEEFVIVLRPRFRN